jgi:transcriptional regulator with XRE-family HTH domain
VGAGDAARAVPAELNPAQDRHTGRVAAYRSSAAQAARQALADRLRELRVDAGLTAIQLAAAAGWHRTKVSRLEHAVRSPSMAEVRAWCVACGAEDQTDDLLAALRAVEGTYVQWQRLDRGGLRRLQESYVPLFERTRLMRVYCSVLVPGLLQTPGYATAVLTAIVEQSGGANDVAQAVPARMARARVLHEGGHRFAFVIEEAVLRHGLGGGAVMAAQLGHLLEAMSVPSVSLGVIPFAARRPRIVVENFNLYDLARVEVELLAAQVTITAPSEIKLYAEAFEELAAMAVYGSAARALIAAAVAALDG